MVLHIYLKYNYETHSRAELTAKSRFSHPPCGDYGYKITHMRTRDTIARTNSKYGFRNEGEREDEYLRPELEVLFDIRDLLIELVKPKEEVCTHTWEQKTLGVTCRECGLVLGHTPMKKEEYTRHKDCYFCMTNEEVPPDPMAYNETFKWHLRGHK
jgi:hypothetical protein